ncbi:MAG: hypothetical protein IJ348_02790 [Alistipes sp.]|nr:hypothetical protein [Alistipes sp.]
MKKFNLMLLAVVCGVTPLFAQENVESTPAATEVQEEGKVLKSENIENYRRSSLYSVLVKHSDAKYGEVIDSVFMVMPTPDKFNNHDLAVKSFESSAKNKKVPEKKRGTDKDPNVESTAQFIQENDVARALVSKWFNRDAATGALDMELIKERAYYDASASAIQEADASGAGRAVLVDAGPDLIGKTFMLVNDITFVDKGEQSAKAATGVKIFGAIAGALIGADLSGITDTVGDAVNEIDGFKVNVITYLYRLKWNEEVANTLYESYWVDASAPDAEKKAAYEQSDLFQMEYVGHSFASGGVTTSKTFSKKSHGEQMAVACTRAIDKAIVNLQRAYDEFKVNTPIFAVNQDTKQVEVKIGLKEGVNSKSRYEVLMVDESKGYREYKRVGMLKPVADKIWDNRFGALEEAEMLKQAEAAGEKVKKEADGEESGNVYLTSTTFDIIEGAGNIYEGMLIREVRIN